MNSVCIDGHLVRDPETVTPTGSDYAGVKFSIANNDNKKKALNGEWETIVSFFDCIWWTKKSQYWLDKMHKGDYVSCQAEARQDRWEKDGQTRSKIQFTLVKPPTVKPKNEQSQTSAINSTHEEDEIPF